MRKIAAIAYAFLLAAGAQAHDHEHIGSVALADWPYCNVLVFAVDGTFTIAEWQDGLWLYAQGDGVIGPLDSPGSQTLWIDNAVRLGAMTVAIEETHVGWPAAQMAFYDRCAIPGLRHTASLRLPSPGERALPAPH